MKKQKIFSLLFFLLLIIYFSVSILKVNAPITMTVNQDSWFISTSPDTNYGSSDTAFLGWDNGVTAYREAVFGFSHDDIQFWVNEYNEGNVPIAVNIRVWGRLYMSTPTVDFYIKGYRIIESWNETTITYNTRPTLKYGNISYQLIDGSGGTTWQYYYLDITDDFTEVLGEYNGTNFYGYQFFGLDVNSYNVWIEFSTKEHTTNPPAKIYYGYPEPEYEEYEETFFQTQAGADFIVLFFFIFIPPLILAFEFSQHNASPSLGFVGGLILTVSIGYMTGLMPLWFVFCCVLIIILFLFMTLKGKGWL